MERYNNYHKHDHYGNISTLDTITKVEDYCKRAVELGHTTIFTTNHGMQGNLFQTFTLAQQYNLKMIVGAEVYYVNNRKEKDRSNKHLIIIAKNNNGVRDINRIISEANVSGFYYKPRIDKELLFSLNPNNVIITSACIAGIWNDEKLIQELNSYFKDNFYLEVQNHNVECQKNANKTILKLHYKYNIPIIHANDSHYIKPEESKYRTLFLKAKNVNYPEEDNFILDYPDYDTIVKRYKEQGILNEKEIKECLYNTLIFDKCDNFNLINTEIKLPSVSQNPTQELRQIVAKAWNKEKNNIPVEEHKKYMDAILYEMNIIEKTHMEDYFIIDYKVVKKAQEEYNGKLTNTGRGSAPSFYITKLLGLTDIDRISAPITLFPTRFMSVERILGAKSLPDIDLNTANTKPFIKATEDLLGKENCAWMIAWKPLQKSSAFRLYCKAIGLDINDYNDIALDISECSEAKKISHYEEDKYWGNLIKESSKFVGVVESVSQSPCSMLLYDKPVAEEVGLIRTVDAETKEIKMCCLLDGYNCDKYKYLKNDYLTVSVWAIIKEVCSLVNISIPTIKELNELLDDRTFNIYKNGLTCTINQADSDFATGLVKTYQPKSVSEISSFVAIIRPGCASLLQDFVHRKPYTTGIKELDDLLIEGSHRMIYQELIMKYLIWLGISETHSYDIIKKIAKKKFKEKELNELKEQLKQGWKKQVGKEDGFEETWQVVENAASYSFNASHSLSYAYDSLYGAYLKSHYPLEYYTTVLNFYSDDSVRTNKLLRELNYFKIELKPIKFGKSIDKYVYDKKSNYIYKGIKSIKYCNDKIANELYSLSQNKKYTNFIDLLKDINSETSINNRQLKILTGLDFFSEFGKNKYLLNCIDIYNNFVDRVQINKKDLEKFGLTEYEMNKFSNKETASLYKELDIIGLIKYKISKLENKNMSVQEKVKFDYEYLESTDYINPNVNANYYIVVEFKTYKDKSKPYILLRQIKTGEQIKTKVKKPNAFKEAPFKQFSVLQIPKFDEECKVKNINGKWQKTNEKEPILNEWDVIRE